MQTQIHRISEVTCDLEVEATAEDIAPDLDAALRRRRARTDMKGFRAGKVPLGLVKRIHGQEVASRVAHDKVLETFHAEIIENGQYDVIGRPLLTSMDYEPDGDLRAVIRFGIRPDIALKNLSGEKIPRLKREVTDEDVAESIGQIRKRFATLVPVETEEITENFQVSLDMQRLDAATGAPVIGEKEEGVTFFVHDEHLQEAIREGVLGKRAGETCVVDLPPEEGAEGPARRYRLSIRETRRQDLPVLDDAFAEKVTEGEISSVDEWKSALRARLAERWEEQANGLLAEHMVERMMDLHDIPVPESAVEQRLDQLFEAFAARNDGKLPDDFDLDIFREAQRNAASRQAKWGLLRDAYIEQERLEVTEDDLDAWFDAAVEGREDIAAETLRRGYERAGGLEDIRGRIMSRKVFARLAETFEIEDADPEAFEERTSPNPSSILAPN